MPSLHQDGRVASQESLPWSWLYSLSLSALTSKVAGSPCLWTGPGGAQPAGRSQPIFYYQPSQTPAFFRQADAKDFGSSICEGRASLGDVRLSLARAAPLTHPDGSFTLFWECPRGRRCCPDSNDCCDQTQASPVFSSYALFALLLALMLATALIIYRVYRTKASSEPSSSCPRTNSSQSRSSGRER